MRNAVKAANSSCKKSTENRPKHRLGYIDDYFGTKDRTYENKKQRRMKAVSEDDDIQLIEDSKSASDTSYNPDDNSVTWS